MFPLSFSKVTNPKTQYFSVGIRKTGKHYHKHKFLLQILLNVEPFILPKQEFLHQRNILIRANKEKSVEGLVTRKANNHQNKKHSNEKQCSKKCV